MNMRWAWTLPVLSTLATTLVAGPAWAQGGAATPVGWAPIGFAAVQASGAVDPAYVAAMQAQAYAQMAAQQAAMSAMYPQQAMAQQQGMYAPAGGRQTATVLVPAAAYPQPAMYQQAAMYPQPVMPK